jgi:methylisocitrate lyase
MANALVTFSTPIGIYDNLAASRKQREIMMSSSLTPGQRFKNALATEKPLQIAGTINAYTAKLAESVGFKALYLSGGGVAAASYGLPDLGITTLQDVLTDAERITAITDKPLLVDVDTGWGSAFNIARMVRSMIQTGVAAIHMEDQAANKRCGHRPNKQLVSTAEMADRLKAAVDARTDADFFIMARTDACANEGLAAAIERAQKYVEAGADAIFAEALTDLTQYQQFCQAVSVPVLANITEFGKTPLYTQQELYATGIKMVLYPLSAFRAMSQAALTVYETIYREGSQKSVLDRMQTRDDLYRMLDYLSYEHKLDKLFEKEKR